MKTLILLAISTTIIANNIEISPIQNKILPFKLGYARVVQSKHTFIHFVELDPLVRQLYTVQNYFKYINHSLIFSALGQASFTYKSTLYSLVKHAHYIIKITENKLDNLVPHINIRNRRGLFDAVGKASKWLFGTLDNDDATRYDKALQTLSHDQNFAKNELNLQISLTKELIESYNKTISTLDKNQRQIGVEINYLREIINTTVDGIIQYIRAQNILDQVIMNCQNLITFIDNLENAIMFAKLNTLHNSIITTSNLAKLITDLTGIYGENKIPKFDNILSYYQIAGMQVSFTQNKVIFAIHIPILDPNTFDYFHLYPIPKNNLTLIPESPYLILGTSVHQYEENECPSIENTYLCQNHLEPIEEDCIITMIQEAKSTNCQAVPVYMHKYLTRQISNQYVLVVPADRRIRIRQQCTNSGHLGHLVVHQPSLLKIGTNCSIQIGPITYSNQKDLIIGEPFHLPIIEIPELAHEYSDRPLQLQHVDLENLYKLKKEADVLQNQDPMAHDSYIINSRVTLPMTTLCTLAVLTTAVWYLWKKFSKKSPEEPREEKPENNPSALFSHLVREELRT